MPEPLDPVSPSVDAYLALLKSTLLDEPYLDNEVRIDYLLELEPGQSWRGASCATRRAPCPCATEQLARARSSGHGFDERATCGFLAYASCGRPPSTTCRRW